MGLAAIQAAYGADLAGGHAHHHHDEAVKS